jgi:hypothetical protein
MDGKINIDDPITHTMPLENINDSFELMHSGESIRGVAICVNYVLHIGSRLARRAPLVF